MNSFQKGSKTILQGFGNINQMINNGVEIGVDTGSFAIGNFFTGGNLTSVRNYAFADTVYVMVLRKPLRAQLDPMLTQVLPNDFNGNTTKNMLTSVVGVSVPFAAIEYMTNRDKFSPKGILFGVGGSLVIGSMVDGLVPAQYKNDQAAYNSTLYT